MFDNDDELRKIAQHHPNASLCLRIAERDPECTIDLSSKFGAPQEQTTQLLKLARRLKLNVVGVSFHVGTGAKNGKTYVRALEDCQQVIIEAKKERFEVEFVDIGGGFSKETFDQISPSLQDALRRLLPGGTRIIAEPGRFFAQSAFTLACKVIGRRMCDLSGQEDRETRAMLYLSDGVYGNFMNVVMEHLDPEVYLLKRSVGSVTKPASKSLGTYRYSLWGPTCDSLDKISECRTFEEEVEVEDWLFFPNMGGTLFSSTAECADTSQHIPVAQPLRSMGFQNVVQLYI